jgi:hypothetical protein
MRQFPAESVFEQVPVAVLQVSVVHETPSLHDAHALPIAPHEVAVSDARATHVPVPSFPQPVVQHEPDSQRPPAHAVPFETLLQADVLVAVLQTWHELPGLMAPFG